MKIIQENQLKFLIRYGLLITALVEWALYHSVNAYHLLLFLLIVIVAQLDYYSRDDYPSGYCVGDKAATMVVDSSNDFWQCIILLWCTSCFKVK